MALNNLKCWYALKPNQTKPNSSFNALQQTVQTDVEWFSFYFHERSRLLLCKILDVIRLKFIRGSIFKRSVSFWTHFEHEDMGNIFSK